METLRLYIPIAVQLCYAVAGVVAILGSITVYILMTQNDMTEARRKVFETVGACVILIVIALML